MQSLAALMEGLISTRKCQGIADLESSMQQLRDILVVSTLLIANMKIVAAPPSLLPG